MIIYFAFSFHPLIFISDQYFGSTIVTVCVHLTRATKNSFPCVSRWSHQVGWTMWVGITRPKYGTPQSLAKWCATLTGSGNHRIACKVVWTMGSSDHPKFGTPPQLLVKLCERWGVATTRNSRSSVLRHRASYHNFYFLM